MRSSTCFTRWTKAISPNTGIVRIKSVSNCIEYSKYTFSMFGGEITPVTMVFQNRMMGAVMDRFGRDVVVMKEDERHFRITVSVAVSNQFYGWVFGLGKMVRIVSPESVKEGMKKALEDIAQRYE